MNNRPTHDLHPNKAPPPEEPPCNGGPESSRPGETPHPHRPTADPSPSTMNAFRRDQGERFSHRPAVAVDPRQSIAPPQRSHPSDVPTPNPPVYQHRIAQRFFYTQPRPAEAPPAPPRA